MAPGKASTCNIRHTKVHCRIHGKKRRKKKLSQGNTPILRKTAFLKTLLSLLTKHSFVVAFILSVYHFYKVWVTTQFDDDDDEYCKFAKHPASKCKPSSRPSPGTSNPHCNHSLSYSVINIIRQLHKTLQSGLEKKAQNLSQRGIHVPCFTEKQITYYL